MNANLQALRANLSTEYLKFVPATPKVLRGEIVLKAHDSQNLGSIYLSVGGFHVPDPRRLLTGQSIRLHATEKHRHGQVRCYLRGKTPCVRAFDKKGRALSKELDLGHGANPGLQEWDEGYFSWFGTVDYIGTAWSDNDPETCQVITIEDLRGLVR
ncbi:MAG: hypothetical protein H6581_26755 [Bacteroidia bacterium]|nr:hypothetical protein [Bacteroidia bacterium]